MRFTESIATGAAAGVGWAGGLLKIKPRAWNTPGKHSTPSNVPSSAAMLVTVGGLYLWVWGDILIVHLQQPAALLY